MLWIVDKKVVKHVINARSTLVEVPIRISFEYGLRDDKFVEGTLTRKFIFNRKELLRRFPDLDSKILDDEIEDIVDQSLLEYLKFEGYASGNVRLFSASSESHMGIDVSEVPKILLPGSEKD